MGAFQSMDAKVKKMPRLPDNIFALFSEKYCLTDDAVTCPLRSLSLAFSLFLLEHSNIRSSIAPFFEEPRRGRYNVRMWSHYARKILPQLLEEYGYICLGNDSDAIVIGLELVQWPIPIKLAEGYNVVLK